MVEIKIKGLNKLKVKLGVKSDELLSKIIDNEASKIEIQIKKDLEKMHIIYCQTGPVNPAIDMMYKDLMGKGAHNETYTTFLDKPKGLEKSKIKTNMKGLNEKWEEVED